MKLPSLWHIGLVLAFNAALIIGYNALTVHHQGIGEDRATVVYNGKIDKQNIAAAALLAVETKKTAEAEKALRDSLYKQDISDARNKTTLAGLTTQLRTATGTLGRLRDPNAVSTCGGGSVDPKGGDPAGPTNSDYDSTKIGGLFSAGATALFTRLTIEADDINAAYLSCRSDSAEVRRILGNLGSVQ